jgi:hypothetical protein
MKRWYFISGVENHQVEGKSLIIMFLKEIALLKESSKLASFEKRRFNRLTAQLKLKRGCAIPSVKQKLGSSSLSQLARLSRLWMIKRGMSYNYTFSAVPTCCRAPLRKCRSVGVSTQLGCVLIFFLTLAAIWGTNTASFF